jgi:two-component system, cell cycle sensor histidine kinase and response regulator CckA
VPMPKTILIVDDEEIVRKLVRVALRGSDDTDFLEANDAAEALKISGGHSGRIDLLLSDVSMPGEMNGAEMAAELSHARPETKVLLMSGYDAQPLAIKPSWQFIQKPFAAAEIRQRIRNVLENAPTPTLSS